MPLLTSVVRELRVHRRRRIRPRRCVPWPRTEAPEAPPLLKPRGDRQRRAPEEHQDRTYQPQRREERQEKNDENHVRERARSCVADTGSVDSEAPEAPLLLKPRGEREPTKMLRRPCGILLLPPHPDPTRLPPCIAAPPLQRLGPNTSRGHVSTERRPRTTRGRQRQRQTKSRQPGCHC